MSHAVRAGVFVGETIAGIGVGALKSAYDISNYPARSFGFNVRSFEANSGMQSGIYRMRASSFAFNFGETGGRVMPYVAAAGYVYTATTPTLFSEFLTNATFINGRLYNWHAYFRAEQRGFMPTVVDNAIRYGTKNNLGKGMAMYDFQNVRVFTDMGMVMRVTTVYKTGSSFK